jgi:cholest-4-en-3-one 26-monooxygenase
VTATALEEVLRWATPVIHFRRTAAVDTELAGQRIAAGDKVVLFYHSANRDEAVFEDPYRFDVRRDPNPQLAFSGGGPHFCLGAHLARMEMRVMFHALFTRLPDLELAGEPEFMHSMFFNGVKSMPCSFTPTRSPADGE